MCMCRVQHFSALSMYYGFFCCYADRCSSSEDPDDHHLRVLSQFSVDHNNSLGTSGSYCVINLRFFIACIITFLTRFGYKRLHIPTPAAKCHQEDNYRGFY